MNTSPSSASPHRFSPRLACATILVATTSATTLSVHAAAIALTGPTTYTQNYHSLGKTTAAWVDKGTVPGWIAGVFENNGLENLQVTNGSDAQALSGLLNLGAAGNAERALGSRATSTAGFANIAYGVLFQNTSRCSNPSQANCVLRC